MCNYKKKKNYRTSDPTDLAICGTNGRSGETVGHKYVYKCTNQELLPCLRSSRNVHRVTYFTGGIVRPFRKYIKSEICGSDMSRWSSSSRRGIRGAFSHDYQVRSTPSFSSIRRKNGCIIRFSPILPHSRALPASSLRLSSAQISALISKIACINVIIFMSYANLRGAIIFVRISLLERFRVLLFR